MDYILKVLYAFLSVVGTFSSFIKTLVQELPPTLNMMHKKVGLSKVLRSSVFA